MESMIRICSCPKIVVMRAVLLALQACSGQETRGEETVGDDVVQILFVSQNILPPIQ